MEELHINLQNIQEQFPLKKKLINSNAFQEKPKTKIGASWTEERKEQHRERMKEMESKKKWEKLLKPTWSLAHSKFNILLRTFK